MSTLTATIWGVVLFICGTPGLALAEGVSDSTFPAWEERWIHEAINRARSDPQYEMNACGDNCPDGHCYSQVAPLPWKLELNRASRFHSTEMALQNFFSLESACTLVPNIDDIYPDTCDGSANCACVGGSSACAPVCTSASSRLDLFGASYKYEFLARHPGGPDQAFYMWLHESTSSSVCGFSNSNGHRWLILNGTGELGIGYYSGYYTVDFGQGPLPEKIPSGSHYPQQALTVEVWANWYDSNGPSVTMVNVEGLCHTMNHQRGTATNGAWMAEITGVESGCHRYYFEFVDSAGNYVTYPSNGSLAIGSGATCPDWDTTRFTSCVLKDPIFFDGFETMLNSQASVNPATKSGHP